MRILHWTDYFPPFRGGTENVVFALAAEMAQAGHDVAVITNTHPDRAERGSGEYQVRSLPFAEAIEGRDAAAMIRLIGQVAAFKKEFRPDIVHVHFHGTSEFFHLRTLSAVDCPTLVTMHGLLGDTEGSDGGVFGQLLASCDWMSGVSEATRQHALARNSALASRSSVIFNGDARTPRDLEPTDPPYLLISGRHVESKGFDLAIAAMPVILAAHSEARLVVASDGPLRADLEQQAADLGIAHAVRFTGWVVDTELQALVERATAVLVPSRSLEGFGLVALEAALASRPVVCSAIGGLPEVVLDDETGIVLHDLSPDAIADACITLLDDPEAAREMGRAAARSAAARFGLDTQVQSYLELYGRLAAS